MKKIFTYAFVGVCLVLVLLVGREWRLATTRPERPPLLTPSQVTEFASQLKQGDARAEKILFKHFARLEESTSNTQALALVARDTQNGVLQFLLFQGLRLKYECKTEKLVRGYETALPGLEDPEGATYHRQDLSQIPNCSEQVRATVDEVVDSVLRANSLNAEN